MHDHREHTHDGQSMFTLTGVDGRSVYERTPPGRALLRRPLPTAPPKPQRFVRKAASSLTDAEQQAYLQAVQQLVGSGEYERLVQIHLDMGHNMHATRDPINVVGPARFLPWHRQYLVAFEEALGTSVPYWDYERGFPQFLQGFLPLDTPARAFSSDYRLPTLAEMDAVVQVATAPADPPGARFQVFSSLLETGRDDLPMHNQIHMWVGGIMETMASPADPVFWLHHAAIDRLWSRFQARDHEAYPDKLAGRDLILDPWNESAIDVLDIGRLGYRYA
jgi:tyrosinase